ncbi:hypothetical protein [Methylocystis iwaonis]|uniref:hypothetical protein n=1 Tax=Methylocystis iwaonis TaxID=2885079 RepID=UPI002E7BC2FE|nr:hypothetical protein [Methylocystis iwaonis]
MEDPLPARPDNGRRTALKKPAPAPAERISSIVGGESGVGKAGDADKQAQAPLEQRMASLAAALRRARIENAEHSAALADLRAAEAARLELLCDALAPVLAQVPPDCDIFDIAVAPGERPRLFIDQIGFVEMDRDRRTYRFLQDTRHGRITLRETADIDEAVDAVTDYIAHRLIEREKALAVDYASGGAARALRSGPPAVVKEQEKEKVGALDGKAFRLFLYLVEFLGSAAFFGLLAVIAAWAYKTYVAG